MNVKPLRNMRLLLLILISCAWVISSIDATWSLSIDMAHHYALVARLTELWVVPYSGDPSLGEMNNYPRLSHIAAAVAGRFLGSAVLGMQAITLLSIVALWGSLISILHGLPNTARLVAATALSALLWFNHQYLHLDMHAGEVVSNYFYSQLVAQALMAATVAFSLYLERTNVSTWTRYGLLGLAIYLIAGIHLLPALELFAVLIALMAIESLRQVRERRFRWTNGAAAIAWGLAVGLILYGHPSVAIMSQLSNNNGGISSPMSLGAYLAYSFTHLVVSGCVLATWIFIDPQETARRWLGLKYIALYGLAVAGLCLLQVLMFKMGHGSEYAVRKYIFALNTTALFELAMLLAWWVATLAQRVQETASARMANPIFFAIAPALLLVALYCVTPGHASIKTSSLTKLEQQLLLRKDANLPSLAGKYDYVHNVNNLPPIIDYMMSIGVLKAPRVTTQQMTSSGWNWDIVGTIITSENAKFDEDPTCRREAPAGGLVMLDGACISKRQPSRHIIGFTRNHAPTTCVTEGLSVPEDFGTWTSAVSVSLRCPLPVGVRLTQGVVQIDTAGFIIKTPVQRLIAGIQGQPPAEYFFDASHPEHLISLKLPPITAKEVQINFSLPDAKSPQELGLSEDGRKLGVSIRTIEFK